MRIVHIGPDSPHVGYLAGVFEQVAPGSNELVVLTRREAADLASWTAGLPTSTASPHLRAAAGVAAGARGADVVIAHTMTPHAALAFRAAGRRALTVWSGWGGDYYSDPLAPGSELLGPATAALAEVNRPSGRRPLRGRVAQAVIDRTVADGARRASVISAPIPDDEAVMRRRYPSMNGRYGQLNYADVETSFAPSAHLPVGDDILVGNSSSWTNNHVEAFEALARAGVEGRRVVVPLSYGDTAYRDLVLAAGRRLLGHSFHPLVDLLPPQEYTAVVSRCNVVVMNHRRQQGVGNVGIALWSGAHVVLDPDNPLTAFLRRLGLEVATFADLGQGLPSRPVDGEQLEQRRRLLLSFWGRERVLANTAALLSKVAR